MTDEATILMIISAEAGQFFCEGDCDKLVTEETAPEGICADCLAD